MSWHMSLIRSTSRQIKELDAVYIAARSVASREPARILGYAVSATKARAPSSYESRHFHDINEIPTILSRNPL